VGTNVHALEALNLMPDYPSIERVKEQIIVMLLNQRKYNMYWTDKWHASPLYATSHALVALLREKQYLAHTCQATRDWLIHTQRKDGSWGFFDVGTAEETAYVLTALLHYHKYVPVSREVLQRGVTYLRSALEQDPTQYPELWIAKCLYSPFDIIRSAILSALTLYDSMISV
jgi:halimadienyl-diphosphate synthase